MNINIITIGRLKGGDIKSLIDEYLKRTPWNIKIHEHELTRTLTDEMNKKDEGKLLLEKIKLLGGYVIVMDEKGAEYTSPDFSKMMQGLAVKGHSKISFVIGGAAGLSEDVRKAGNEVISLSKMTFPHMMARLFLVEQLYRSFTIIQGKSYHK